MKDPATFEIKDGSLFIDGRSVDLNGISFVKPLQPGANGLVFEAFDNTLERPVAVKFWTPQRKNDNRDKRKQGLAELRKIAQLDHPRIVTVYSAGETSTGIIYAVMEFMRGQTLKEFLASHSGELGIRIHLWDDVAEAVHFAHDKQIYHGDSHDRNVIVREDRGKVIDFGTGIFTRDPKSSSKRESRCLITLLMRMFPEFHTLGLTKHKMSVLPAEVALLCCCAIVETDKFMKELILGTPKRDDYFVKQKLGDIAFQFVRCPSFDPQELAVWLLDYKLDDVNVGFVLVRY